MDVEQRARELLAAQIEYRQPRVAKMLRVGWLLSDFVPAVQDAVAAISAALTPPEGHVSRAELSSALDAAFLDGVFKGIGGIPEGYVLVPVEPTEEMIEAICTEHGYGVWPQGYTRYAQHLRREHAGEGYRAMLAARPEVKP